MGGSRQHEDRHSEKGLEALIVADMTGRATAPTGRGFSEEPEPFIGLHNWLLGDPKAYDRAWTIDLVQLRASKAAANARHNQPGGSRDKQRRIREIWATGKYSSRDICADEECAALGMSFSAARKALRNAPKPVRSIG
jgi:hypothetical protein